MLIRTDSVWTLQVVVSERRAPCADRDPAVDNVVGEKQRRRQCNDARVLMHTTCFKLGSCTQPCAIAADSKISK
eukprot:37228-Prorocentrum_minimum.AAC.1